MTTLARELALDYISFPTSPTCVPPSERIPDEINELLKEFVDIVPDKLLSELPPLRDIIKIGRRDGCQKSILQNIMYNQYVSYPQDQPHQRLTSKKSPLSQK